MKPFEIEINITGTRGVRLRLDASSPRIAVRRALDAELGNRSPQTGRYADRQLESGEHLWIKCRRVEQ